MLVALLSGRRDFPNPVRLVRWSSDSMYRQISVPASNRSRLTISWAIVKPSLGLQTSHQLHDDPASGVTDVDVHLIQYELEINVQAASQDASYMSADFYKFNMERIHLSCKTIHQSYIMAPDLLHMPCMHDTATSEPRFSRTPESKACHLRHDMTIFCIATALIQDPIY